VIIIKTITHQSEFLSLKPAF